MSENTTADLVRESLAEFANGLGSLGRTNWTSADFYHRRSLVEVFGKEQDFRLLLVVKNKFGLKECPTWQETVGDLIAATEREPLAERTSTVAANDEGYSNYAADLAELERRAVRRRVGRREPEV